MTNPALTEALHKITGSLEVFGAHCLKIRDKDGTLVPFVMNRAQRHIHQKVEEQRQRTGKVRALLLKGRQQGGSTYIGARYYWRTSLAQGKRALIITHEQKATDNLFKMVKRYHEHNPFAPHTGATNAKELLFDALDSGYMLATAGSADVGRSNTAQFLHGSEFAFWNNAAMHMAGIGNTVGDQDGTEIIYESTANGIGNAFHQLWQKAEQGIGEYIPIFVPWYWQDEYRAFVKPDFTLSPEDVLYRNAYGLDMEQMQWRANKIDSYQTGFEWLFDQEFPATPALAFRSSTADPYISQNLVSGAANSSYLDFNGPLVIGVDPAEMGPDRTAIVFRQGRLISKIISYQGKNTMETAGLVAKLMQEYKPAGVFIDKCGLGVGIYDRLKELNYGNVYGVISGAAAHESKLYANKRAEVWARMRAWFEDYPCRIPKDLELAADLSAPGYRSDSSGRLLIEKKEDMRARGVRSPDLADALAFTFAEYLPLTPEGEFKSGYPGHKPASNAGY